MTKAEAAITLADVAVEIYDAADDRDAPLHRLTGLHKEYTTALDAYRNAPNVPPAKAVEMVVDDIDDSGSGWILRIGDKTVMIDEMIDDLDVVPGTRLRIEVIDGTGE